MDCNNIKDTACLISASQSYNGFFHIFGTFLSLQGLLWPMDWTQVTNFVRDVGAGCSLTRVSGLINESLEQLIIDSEHLTGPDSD